MRLICAILFFLSVHPTAQPQTVDFAREVRPILSDHCFACHGPDAERRKADLRLDLKETATGNSEGAPFHTENLEDSEAWSRIQADDPDDIMPPPEFKKPLSSAQKDIIKRWIDQGANWDEHWAFVAPDRPKPPRTTNASATESAIDRFVRAKLAEKDLDLSEPADRRTLIRRVTLDLTGLPPTLDEIDNFLNDTGPNAFERVVDRLLNSQRFGERMATFWLDAARYGDTSVFHADGYRNMWAWRDWVISAYNRNMPYDEFSISQIAGDLLPNPTLEQQLASGFNRNNGTTDEGGAIAEEYRVEYAVDRVKTTSMVWLGLSMECAQCHDHKYDPISQKDYYEFYAFFNVSADTGMQTRSGNAEPKIDIPDPDKEKALPAHLEKMDRHRETMETRRVEAKVDWVNWLQTHDVEQNAQWVANYPLGATRKFDLDEGAGNQIQDAREPENKGTIRGKVEWKPTDYGHGVILNGESHIELPDSLELGLEKPFAITTRLTLDQDAAGVLISQQDTPPSDAPTPGFEARIVDKKLQVSLVTKWPDQALSVASVAPLPVEESLHLTIQYNGSKTADGFEIYINESQSETETLKDSGSSIPEIKEALRIGSEESKLGVKALVASVETHGAALPLESIQALANWTPMTHLLGIPASERTEDQNDELYDLYLTHIDQEFQDLTQTLASLEAREQELREPLTTVMVMANMEEPRDTFVLNRGKYDAPTEQKVSQDTPDALPPLMPDAPRDRLGLAEWLFQPSQPLTARVAVNQLWTLFFGEGIVRTPADFGSQGAYPTHPKLLDWLAVEFESSGWNIKEMIQRIVLSKTYRQSSRVPKQLLEMDPENRLLGRAPRLRLQAEFVRDNAMSISGLLLNKMGGPGVKPYQPAGLWKEVGLGGQPVFEQDHGAKLYRRSIYTYWKRSAPPPYFQIFDAPTREKCVIQRPRTNTPLQALATLNDTQYVEAARKFAERIIREGGDSFEDRFAFAYELATAHMPTPLAREVGQDIFKTARDKYENDVEARDQWLAIGESTRNDAIDPTTQAAWAVVASMLLNLDATLNRE